MTIHEVMKKTGLSKRTLHHYDEIGLLRPKRLMDNAYRDYDENDLLRLEQIMLYKELGFSLKDIGRLIDSEQTTQQKMMASHKKILIKKRNRINRIIELIEKRINGEKAVDFMAFDMNEIEQAKREYAAETKERWGNTDAYQQSQQRTKRYNKADWERIKTESADIFKGFATLKDNADERKAAALVEAWRGHISTYYYDCSYEMLAGLADLYITDERFTKNIDKYGEGTAAVMSTAIKKVCEQKMNNG